MEITCPVCGAKVDGTKVYAKFGSCTLPVYQCLQCQNAADLETITFVVLPDGTKLHPADVNLYLQKLLKDARGVRAP